METPCMPTYYPKINLPSPVDVGTGRRPQRPRVLGFGGFRVLYLEAFGFQGILADGKSPSARDGKSSGPPQNYQQ
eukprot:40075-Pyramimonas_sp.AAC.1